MRWSNLSAPLMLTALLPFAVACSDDDDAELAAPLPPTLTYVASSSGLGDNGYNDLIMRGVMQFAEEHPEVELSVLIPSTLDDVKLLASQWQSNLAAADDNNHLLLLGSSEYVAALSSLTLPLGNHRQVLLVEGDSVAPTGEGIATFKVRRYGASYLVGCLAREVPDAFVMAAYEGDAMVSELIAGFCDGYHDQGGGTAQVHYLATDASGFAMADAAFKWTASLVDLYEMALEDPDAFIFPVAGGSNSGVYKYTRDRTFSPLLVCGMDVDASAYSRRVPFSMVLHLDRMVNSLLTRWATDGTLPAHTEAGLENADAVEVIVHHSFYDDIDVYKDYYGDPDYWADGLNAYYATALAKEKAYEEVR